MARSAVNRWIRDRIEVDSRFTKSAPQYIRDIEGSLEKMHAGQRMNAVNHAREYAVLYYGERHRNTPVPARVTARLDELERRAERSDRFDRAREFVQKYGPPEKALSTFMKAPEKTRETKTKIPAEERPASMRSHDIPWMMHSGPIREMSQKHLDQAQKSYEAWPHKEKHSFVEYVQYVQRQWNKSPVERGGDRQQERSREVELSR